MARKTYARLAVLAALIDKPHQDRYGLDLAKAAGLATGTVYPILARLEKDGWVESRWEDIDESAEQRPRRRYYRLVGQAVPAARSEVDAARKVFGLVPAARPRPARGRA
jgi:DNA-binding PadR family transcriptional regulator